MDLKELERHLDMLATLVENDSPLISCYLEMSNGSITSRDAVETRLQVLRTSLPVWSMQAFDEARSRIETFLDGGILRRTRGVAIFARGGRAPFWLPLQFEVPLPNWISVSAAPNIYQLIELKDNYDRYVVLLLSEKSARIIGVNLGSATAHLWNSRPELRRRVGHGWTKDHYQDHRRERTRQFIHDQVRSLDQVVKANGYAHIILAGNARLISEVRKELPNRLAEMLIDSVPACPSDHLPDIVACTLQSFLEHEEQDSQNIAEKLLTQIRTNGLGVAGTNGSMTALKAERADVVVLVKAYDPGPGWECRSCGKLDFEGAPKACTACNSSRLRQFDIREELVRLAAEQHVPVEVVEQNDVLMSLGGVGCLLRYLSPANYIRAA